MTSSSWVSNPCQGKRCYHEAGRCTDCGRTMQEVLEWTTATPQRKREIKAAAQQRLGLQTAQRQ